LTESPGESSHAAAQTVSFLGERSWLPQAAPPPDAARPPFASGGFPCPGGITGDDAMAEKTTKRPGGLSEAFQPLMTTELVGIDGGRYCAPIMESPDPLGVGETSVWGPGIIEVGRNSNPQCF